MRAKKFYALLNEKQDDSVPTAYFNLMQNQALPKSPIKEAYYAHQLWLYFLGIVVHRLNEQQRDDVFFYTWGEHQQKRGANSIASALAHFLVEKLNVSDNKVKTVRLFSDSCIGQNKNFTVLLTLNMLAAISAVFSSQGTLIHAC